MTHLSLHSVVTGPLLDISPILDTMKEEKGKSMVPRISHAQCLAQP